METQEKPSVHLSVRLTVGGGGRHDCLFVVVSQDFELLTLPVLSPLTFSFFWTQKGAQESPALYLPKTDFWMFQSSPRSPVWFSPCEALSLLVFCFLRLAEDGRHHPPPKASGPLTLILLTPKHPEASRGLQAQYHHHGELWLQGCLSVGQTDF